MALRRSHSKSRFHAAMVVLLVSLFWLASTWTCADHHEEADTKVPMDVHIMSKCPDARDCMNKLVLPVMANVSDKIDFRLSMIGTYVASPPPMQSINAMAMLTTQAG